MMLSSASSRRNGLSPPVSYLVFCHLIIWKRENRFILKDLGNRNGTRVNGCRIHYGDTVEVRRGDTIEIGQSVLCIGERISEDMFAFLESLDFYNQGACDKGTVVLEDNVYSHLLSR